MHLLYHPSVLLHDTGLHPENAHRITAFGDLKPVPNLLNGELYLRLVHSQSYIDKVKAHAARAEPLDSDTYMSKDSFEGACAAVGLSIMAMEQRGFALVRPPGHHAFRDSGHGFCLFNNIAIAAQLAVESGKRVLIIDIDGHLGDGTMDIFYQSDQVLFWSMHQYPMYPGNGSAGEIGEGPGKGFTFNVPLPAASADDIMLHAFEYMLPAALDFEPDLVAVSAGFDAHQFDPMLQLKASVHFYYKVAQKLKQHFDKKVFAVLEGGYNIEDLPHCVACFLAGFNGKPLPIDEKTTCSGPSTWETYELHLYTAAGLLSRYWKF